VRSEEDEGIARTGDVARIAAARMAVFADGEWGRWNTRRAELLFVETIRVRHG